MVIFNALSAVLVGIRMSVVTSSGIDEESLVHIDEDVVPSSSRSLTLAETISVVIPPVRSSTPSLDTN